MTNIVLSKSADKWVKQNRWIASLSNGETIFEDSRPINPTWERLAEYVEQYDLSITQLRVQIAGLTMKLPKGQDGYIQKKKAWTTGATGGCYLCIGHVQDNRAVIHEMGSDRSSITIYTKDPGEPWVIYKSSIRRIKKVNYE